MRGLEMRITNLAARTLLFLLAAMAVQSCYYLQASSRPIEQTYYPVASGEGKTRAKDLLVMLPGIGDYPKAFQRNQFIQEMKRRQLPLDAVAVNAHIGYYSDRTLLKRLKNDVVEPALEEGYERIHFMGISLGGYGTLLYMREYPEDLTSAILMAPYLGQPNHYGYLLEVTEFPEKPHADSNLWPWLEKLPSNQRRKIHLAYGLGDQYSEGQELLSRYLPRENTTTVAGGHNWSTWQILWPRLLIRDRFFGERGASMAER